MTDRVIVEAGFGGMDPMSWIVGEAPLKTVENVSEAALVRSGMASDIYDPNRGQLEIYNQKITLKDWFNSRFRDKVPLMKVSRRTFDFDSLGTSSK